MKSIAVVATFWDIGLFFTLKFGHTGCKKYCTLLITSLSYIKSYKDTKLDAEPNFKYLGHPMNSYHLVRHVAFAYEYIANTFEPMTNATKEFLGN